MHIASVILFDCEKEYHYYQSGDLDQNLIQDAAFNDKALKITKEEGGLYVFERIIKEDMVKGDFYTLREDKIRRVVLARRNRQIVLAEGDFITFNFPGINVNDMVIFKKRGPEYDFYFIIISTEQNDLLLFMFDGGWERHFELGSVLREKVES